MHSLKQRAWCLVSSLACLSLANSSGGDSLNVELLTSFDYSGLGAEGLPFHGGTYTLTIDSQCLYTLQVDFKEYTTDNMKDSINRQSFGGECDKVAGADLHKHNRNWLQFPNYVKQTTGFDHMSLYPRPCGMEPLGRRQPRYDVNFYATDAHHRSLWFCRSFDRPEQCEYNQPNFLGRAHFTIPRYYRNVDLIPNTPPNFTYDPDRPMALEFEGLIVTDRKNLPQAPSDMNAPEIEMSTYDGDTASFRVVIPYKLVAGEANGSYQGAVSYEYQSMKQLPSGWTVNYDGSSKIISVTLNGTGNLCGTAFESAKSAAESATSTPATTP